MPLLVVGSIAYDTIKTPHGGVEDAVGGSAVYFSLAANLFHPVRLVGVVGSDFLERDLELLRSRSIDTAGLEVIVGGRTFRWCGEYSANMNERQTLSVELNVFEDFQPKIPSEFRRSRFVFLANGSPVTQLRVLEQVEAPEFVMADTMDLWIQTQHAELLRLLEEVDGIVINDSEAMLLTDCHNLLDAGRAILGLGPRLAVIKKGEHGAVLFTEDEIVPLPAYPTRMVKDPTGAGDSFAGALMGYLAREAERVEVPGGGAKLDARTFRRALAFGTVAASFTVEDYGVARLAAVKEEEAWDRFERYRSFLAL